MSASAYPGGCCVAVALVFVPSWACGRSGGSRPLDGPRELRVDATRPWQATGIRVEAERPFRITQVAGRIRDRETEIPGGGGSDYVCGDPGCCEPMPNVRRSALIGRVGRHTFAVADGGTFRVPAAGELSLRINDCDEGLEDNAGELTATFVP